MKKKASKRIGCAVLATQMLLTPMAEAASRIRLQYYSPEAAAAFAAEKKSRSESILERVLSATSDTDVSNESTPVDDTAEPSNEGNAETLDNEVISSSNQTTPATESDGEDSAVALPNAAQVAEAIPQVSALASEQGAMVQDNDAQKQNSVDTLADTTVEVVTSTDDKNGKTTDVNTESDSCGSAEIDSKTTNVNSNETNSQTESGEGNVENGTDVATGSEEEANTTSSLTVGETNTTVTSGSETNDATASQDETNIVTTSDDASPQVVGEEEAILTATEVPQTQSMPLQADSAVAPLEELGVVQLGLYPWCTYTMNMVYLAYGFGPKYGIDGKGPRNVEIEYNIEHGNWYPITPVGIDTENEENFGSYVRAYYLGANDSENSFSDAVEEELPRPASFHTVPTDRDTLPRLPNKEFAGWYVADVNNMYEILDDATIDDYFYKYGDYIDQIKRLEYNNEWSSSEPFDTEATLSDYAEVWEENNGSTPFECDTNLMLIAKWNDSSDATATSFNMMDSAGVECPLHRVTTTNTVSVLEQKTWAELQELATNTANVKFDYDQPEYFIRVPVTTDSLTFDMETYEPGSVLEIKSWFDDKDNPTMSSVCWHCEQCDKDYATSELVMDNSGALRCSAHVVKKMNVSKWRCSKCNRSYLEADTIISDGVHKCKVHKNDTLVQVDYHCDQCNKEYTAQEIRNDNGVLLCPVASGLHSLTRLPASNLFQHEEIGKWGLNSVDNPARGHWSFCGNNVIPLSVATEKQTYNTIQFTVVAPDGVTTRTYTIYVQRLGTPTMILEPGNSPAGMIWRDTYEKESGTAPEREKAIKNYYVSQFKENRTFDVPNQPTQPNTEVVGSSINNDGYVYKGKYSVDAWGHGTEVGSEGDYDLDPDILIVYLNSEFNIPYFEVTNSLGTTVAKTDSVTQSLDIEWNLELATVDKLGPEVMSDSYAGNGTLQFHGDMTTDTISIRGINVKPGFYDLIYTYRDGYDGESYVGNQIYANSVEKTNASKTFVRKILVLPTPGDVDLDGEATPADGSMLERLVKTDDAQYGNFFADIAADCCTDVLKSLYWHRVCHVAYGLTSNTLEVQYYKEGYHTQLKNDQKSSSSYFYLPNPLNGLEMNRSTRPRISTAETTLGVKYLGKGTNVNALNPAERVDFIPGDSVDKLEVFWVGVNLSDVPASLSGDVTSLTLTLSYSDTYVMPYVPEGQSWSDYIMSVNPQWNGYTMTSGKLTIYGKLQGSGVALTPNMVSNTRSNTQVEYASVKDLRFSIYGSGKTLGNTLLRVPFVLKGFPLGKKSDKTDSAILVDMALGMWELSIGTSTGSGAWNNQPDDKAVISSAAPNLAQELKFVSSEGIPLGEDKTPRYILYVSGTKENPTYGEAFTSERFGISTEDNKSKESLPPQAAIIRQEGSWPPGLTYDANGNGLSGTPQAAGEYNVKLTYNNRTIPFQIIVDKAPLTLTLMEGSKYYGETTAATYYLCGNCGHHAPATRFVNGKCPNCNSTNYAERSFAFEPTQIKALDNPNSKVLTGLEDLHALIGASVHNDYKLVTNVNDDTPVLATNYPDSTAWLKLSGFTSKNYEFYYVQKTYDDDGNLVSSSDRDADGKPNKFATAKLNILKRPIRIAKVNKDPLGVLWQNATVETLRDTTQEYSIDSLTAGEISKYSMIPLTTTITTVGSDQLELGYEAYNFRRNGESGAFKLTEEVEYRDALVRNLSLTDNADVQNSCYQLAYSVPTDNAARIQVKKRVMSEISIAHMPEKLTYNYGERLNLQGLVVRIDFEDSGELSPSNTLLDLRSKGLTVKWTTGEGVVPGEDAISPADEEVREIASGSKVYLGERLAPKDQAAKRWLYIVTGNCKPLWVGPYTIKKKELTLTVQNAERYYGEKNPEWVVKYDPNQIKDEWEKSQFPNLGATNTVADFVGEGGLSGWDAEKLAVAARVATSPNAVPVDVSTDAGTYYIVISGTQSNQYTLESDNYKFRFNRNAGTANVTSNNQYGYGTLRVLPRPVLATKINSSAGFLYSDTVTLQKTDVSATDFVLQLPQAYDPNNAKTTTYYVNGLSTAYMAKLPLTGSVVCGNDADDLKLIYQADFIPDNNAAPYFKLEESAEAKEVQAKVSQLKLPTNGKAKNYLLVYPTWDAAHNGWVGNGTEADSRVKGEVVRKKIHNITVTHAPARMNYTYGDSLNLSGLQVRITYITSAGYEEKSLKYYDLLGSQYPNTFAQYGLSLEWSDGKTASGYQTMSVTAHNGKHLVVVAPNYNGGTIRADVPGDFTVLKKEITLEVGSQTRYYGEPNGDYTFRFDIADLIEADQALVGSYTLTGLANAVDDEHTTEEALVTVSATSDALKAVDNNYIGPAFTTAAKQKAPVGIYILGFVEDSGSMGNYQFVCKPATITVEKRPIVVAKVVKEPVYSVSVDALDYDDKKTFSTTCYEGGTYVDESGVTRAHHELNLEPSSASNLTNGLVDGDSISIAMTLTFDANIRRMAEMGFQASPTMYETDVIVAVSDMTLATGGDNDNYQLIYTKPTNETTYASVHRREIQKIEIQQLPRMDYTYGETMDLSGMLLKVYYKDSGGSTNHWEYKKPSDLSEVHVTYWEGNTPPTAQELGKKIGNIIKPGDKVTYHEVTKTGGDHLTISKDSDKFAHNGKYLMVSAQSAVGKEFVEPVLTSRTIKVVQKTLTYRLTALDKTYDNTNEAAGTIQLMNVYKDPITNEGDQVWVVNGHDYTGEIVPGYDYIFHSSNYADAEKSTWHDNYGTGITFSFNDANVKWEHASHDNYLREQHIGVTATNIKLAGPDKDNYKIVTKAAASTDGTVLMATIAPKERTAPDVDIQLSVNEHTNTVTVTATPAEPVGDSSDEKNEALHYEYALVYVDEDTNELVTTGYQDSPYFGGEKVTVDIPVFNPDGTPAERPEGTGGGQTIDKNDPAFGTREALPRGTFLGALVRFAPTNNYMVSKGTASFTDGAYAEDEVAGNDTLETALKAASSVMSDTYKSIPAPQKDTVRQEERVPGNVVKTYTYRIDVVSTSEERDISGTQIIVPILEEAWFTDVATFKDDRELDRLLNNLDPALYYGYFWDAKQSISVELGNKLDLSKAIEVVMPIEDANGKEVGREPRVMNANPPQTVRFYVPVYSRSSNSLIIPTTLTISPGIATLRVDGDPIQLYAIFTPLPESESGKKVYWKSSDETVVRVSENGLLTAVAPGSATITARSMLGGLTATLTVTVLPAGEIPYEGTMFDATYAGAYMFEDEDGLFRPERFLTRRELVLIMEHFFRGVEGIDLTPLQDYVDVPEDADYRNTMENLERYGILKGISKKVFAPRWYTTRAEISTILCRMLMLPLRDNPDGPHAFIDSTPDKHWAWAYIDALAEAGITKGTGDGNYSPDRLLTRAEVAVFIARILATKTDMTATNLIIPQDVQSAYWGYEGIIRALNKATTKK